MTDKPPRNSENDFEIMTDAEKNLYADSKDSVGNVVAWYSRNGRKMGGSAGSGFFAKTDSSSSLPACTLVTDNHVISPQDASIETSFEISLNNGKIYPAKVVAQDLAHDLAALQVQNVEDPDRTCKPLILDGNVPAGEDRLLRLSRTRWDPQVKVGNFKGVEKRRDQTIDEERKGEDLDRDLIVTNTYVTLGRNYSGGAYLNAAGKAVAIHDAAQGDSKSLATPAKDIINMLDALEKKQ
jgi:S1-C subfamily serine protease